MKQRAYEARGRSGRAIIAWPDKDIVAVVTGRGLDVRFDLRLGSDLFALPVGMDGVPRFSDAGPTGIPVGGSKHLRIRGELSENAERVELEFTDPGEYFPAQTVSGSSVPSCS